jgi:hypothetical protein
MDARIDLGHGMIGERNSGNARLHLCRPARGRHDGEPFNAADVPRPPSVKRQKLPEATRNAPCGPAWAEKIGSGASGVGHATTPARPNADGGIDFSSRTVPVAGHFTVRGHAADYKVGDRQVGRARTR